MFFHVELEHVRCPDWSEMTTLQYTDKQQETPLNRMKLYYYSIFSAKCFFLYTLPYVFSIPAGGPLITKLNINML